MYIKAVPFAVGPKPISHLVMYFFPSSVQVDHVHNVACPSQRQIFSLHHPTPIQASQSQSSAPFSLRHLLPVLFCPALSPPALPPTAMVQHYRLCIILRMSWGVGAPGWRSRLSVRLQPGHDLAVREFEPRVRLWADGSEPGACFRFCVSLSFWPSPVHALSLSVPKKKKMSWGVYIYIYIYI